MKKKQERELYGVPLKKRMQSEKRDQSNQQLDQGEADSESHSSEEAVGAPPREVLGFGAEMRVDTLTGKAKARLRKRLNKQKE